MRLHRLSLARSMALVAVVAVAFAWLRFVVHSLDEEPDGASLLGFHEGVLDLGVIGMVVILAIGLVAGLHRRERGLAFLLCGSGVAFAYAAVCWLFPDSAYETFGVVVEPLDDAYLELLPTDVARRGPYPPVYLWPLIFAVVALFTLPQSVLALIGAYTIGTPLVSLLGGLVARSGPLADAVMARHSRLEEIERKLESLAREVEELKQRIGSERRGD